MKEFKVLISALFVLILMACGDKRADERIVSVTIEPQRYFAEKIAGDKFKINCVVPAGQSPETYDPTPQQMVQVGKSQGYLRIGSIGFEQAWMDNIRNNNPGLKVFDLSEGIDLLKSPEEEEEHDHHHHHHADEVFTSWGKETPKKYNKEELDTILQKLSKDDSYGMILRSKGILQTEDGSWIQFDLVPGEYEIREGSADYTGRICVIGAELNEDKLAE